MRRMPMLPLPLRKRRSSPKRLRLKPMPRNTRLAAEPEPVLGEVLGGDVIRWPTRSPRRRTWLPKSCARSGSPTLKQAIGINDKFLLLRDLFGGDTERYERTIDRLNEFDDLDDCIIYISENYDWNPSSDGVRFLMELLERKLS